MAARENPRRGVTSSGSVTLRLGNNKAALGVERQGAPAVYGQTLRRCWSTTGDGGDPDGGRGHEGGREKPRRSGYHNID